MGDKKHLLHILQVFTYNIFPPCSLISVDVSQNVTFSIWFDTNEKLNLIWLNVNPAGKTIAKEK